jgi:hypothetical protein
MTTDVDSEHVTRFEALAFAGVVVPIAALSQGPTSPAMAITLLAVAWVFAHARRGGDAVEAARGVGR